jgi:hypothetical protein
MTVYLISLHSLLIKLNFPILPAEEDTEGHKVLDSPWFLQKGRAERVCADHYYKFKLDLYLFCNSFSKSRISPKSAQQ